MSIDSPPAPAGYGKTTLLGEWAHRKTSESLPPLPITWFTLDEGDNDTALFLAYLVAALQRLNPACGATAQTLLTDLPNPASHVRRIIGALINDIKGGAGVYERR
jgi:LuxR family maltose regulon positive regulatory protein